MRPRVVVLGSNFGGLTAALAVQHELAGDVDVMVVSASDRFLFTPSLIWLPFGKRMPSDITFPVAPTLEHAGIEFVHAAATAVDPAARTVTTDDGAVRVYDYLVVATGYRNDEGVVPGLENTSTITTLDRAIETGAAWRRFLEQPGDVVIAATQGAGCFGAAYEFLFNTAHQLKKAGLHKRTRLTYVTSEPFLGHFGIGGLPHGEQLLGMFLKKQGIESRVGIALERAEEDAIILANGERLPFSFSMVVPPFLGQDFLRDSGLADAKGFVPVRPTYQSEKHDEVYAVGVAAAVEVPWTTSVPVGVPKTGFPTEQQAHVAARNIAHQVRGEAPTDERPFGDIKAVCVMDAGNNGVVILADKMLPPRKHGVLVPGPQAHLMKLAFEKYFLWKMEHGYVQLP
ncbi:NAD(P)/FAD-dependent oxidoreductase [Nocardioides sp. SLBN-35]|uniref:NAD(P)/FAD-dependent oxidoreductase n=1 Tax=Nocardioides sp. SLBN-35 TaxID=2768445 RepID=UPI00116AB4F6|nr:FAD-dependent oxidoreductase [Nocardioides sp. SLBN-35]TQK71283.1 sulfide-quinone oxidoreductase [Nocardioides sp. SLBN-35]